ncbi:hypothetical protein [Streptomyces sp. NPDC048603]|uniref:hypothetical protein n=1 Tax=Streptomyces sp. NPDC048603 TaxID=3365577 RepID=UPI00370FD87B
MFLVLWVPLALLAVGSAWLAARGTGTLSPAQAGTTSWWVTEPEHAACNECGGHRGECGGTQNCPSGCFNPGVD